MPSPASEKSMRHRFSFSIVQDIVPSCIESIGDTDVPNVSSDTPSFFFFPQRLTFYILKFIKYYNPSWELKWKWNKQILA